MAHIMFTAAGQHLQDKIVEGVDGAVIVPVERHQFSNGEIYTRPLINIRKRDIYIIASGCSVPGQGGLNDSVVETLILLDACKRADAASITLICPCFPYIRSDKKVKSREAIAAKAIAKAYEPYINRVAVVDAHFSQFQGFFDIPVDNLYSVQLFAEYLADEYLGQNGEYRDQYVLVSPDNGGSKRVEHYAELLKMNHVIMNKKRDYTKSNTVLATELFGSRDAESLRDRTGIVIDDIIDSAGTIVEACKKLDEFGFRDYILIATHGIFSKPAMQRIESNERIRAVIVTDSVVHADGELSEKVTVLTLGRLLSRYISRLDSDESVSVLFRDRPLYEDTTCQYLHT